MNRPAALLARVAADALYRTSGLLVINLAALSGLGFAFWTIAARLFPAADVGVLNGWIAASTLLATVGGLGLGNTLIRQLANHREPRRLIVTCLALLATVGALLCLIALLFAPTVAPDALDLRTGGGARVVVLLLIIVSALSGLVDASLIAAQAGKALIVKNLVGGLARCSLLPLMTDAGVTGLLVAYTAGAVLAALLAWRAVLAAYPPTSAWQRPALALARPFVRFSIANYLGGVVGILPATLVPLIVLAVDGPTAAAHFGIAFLLVGFLNFLPSSIAQAFFAQASRPGVDAAHELRKAMRTSYVVMIPAVAAFALAAPLLLRVFGDSYAAAATTPLRILALAGLATALTYLVDAALNVHHRPLAYGAMNMINALLVIGGTAVAVHSGLTAVAWAWLGAQGASALIGLAVIRTPRGTIGKFPSQRRLRHGG